MRVWRHFFSGVFVISFLVTAVGVSGQEAAVRAEPGARANQARATLRQREQWFRRGREAAGQPAAALRYRAYQQKLRMRAARLAVARTQSLSVVAHASSPVGWTSLGPAPLASDASGNGVQDYNWVSGRATAVAVDHADAAGNTVYIGGAYGGVWKSTNAGPLSPSAASVTWAPLIDNQATLAVGAIAIQPQLSSPDPTQSVILVGTGETNSSTDSHYGLGILRSADAGNTWTLITQDSTGTHPFAGMGVSALAFSTVNSNLVVAAMAGTSQGELNGLQSPVTANLGLYASADGGITWNYDTSKDGPSTVGPGSVTAVVYNANAAPGTFFAAVRFHGFYSSIDGMNWTRLTNQPGGGLSTSACPASPTLQTCPFYRGELAVVPGRNEMYAWYVDSNDADQGIWETTNGGSTWTQIVETGITNCGDLIGGCGTENGAYNLTLAAVPDGSGTDLYAGAVNLFKCQITRTFPTCDPNVTPAPPPQANFLNLTHVYGCPPDLGSIAHVHPSQHAMDFLPINGGAQVVMYFANDGGIYRALDGYGGLTSGTCGTPNLFDSLNQTLGSMTQFVAFAQHPTDANTLLGGTQGNGSPGTASAQIDTTWSNVNSGDGGYSEINPDPNSTEWFAENTGVSIERCENGISCRAADFDSNVIVSNSTVGGDEGPLYTPYILDPQNSGELIVGTCRVWRGTTMGSGFAALSNNFETGGSDVCSGNEVNLVRALAAGGPKDSNGLSNVLYAGTEGTGSLVTTPAGGGVWVTTNAGGGTALWIDSTETINPGHFPISSIVIDASDITGQTAYVTIMGFHVSHVWQTTNAGQTWTDFTANLPDAPANAVSVDSTSGAVYVGTDLGVFVSSTSSPANWSEVGPAPESGLPGYLPDVAVTALRLFNMGTTKLLRASTYGRGIWQFPLTTNPDFQIAFPNPVQTVFASQIATFNGVLSEFNNYSSQVMLSCTAESPAPLSTCMPSASPVLPTAAGTPFTLTASAPLGDYSFALLGAGSDTNQIAHQAALTLHVVDFSLSAPAPGTAIAPLGATSPPVTMQVDFLGSYPTNGIVALACAAPPGLTCNFFPSPAISPSLGNSVKVTMTVAAASGAPTGSSTVSITASSSDAGSKTITQSLSVTVTSSEDYTVAVGSAPAATAVGQQVTLQGTVTGLNGYQSAVQLTCVAASTAPPPTCILNPTAVTASAGGASFTVTASSPTAANYSFSAQGVGADAGSTTHTIPVVLNFFDFAISPNPGSQTMKAGQPATYVLSVTPEGLASFPQAVAYACSQVPALGTCSFAPTQISSGSGVVNVTLIISTTAAVASLHAPERRGGKIPLYALWLPMLGIVLASARWTTHGRRRSAAGAVLGMVLLLTILQLACGGGGLTGGTAGGAVPAQPGTPPGTYTVVVNATEGAGAQQVQHSVSLTLTVQ